MSTENKGKQLLSEAQWIWPGDRLYDLSNTYAHFRKDFSLSDVPKNTLLYVTADAYYRLWVNGSYICRGPARGYQSHWPYDEAEIAPFLKTGNNYICVEVYSPGVSTFSYRFADSAGMLCAADIGESKIRSDATWLCRIDAAHKKDTAHYSIQLAFQEHVDASKDGRGWITSENMPEGWRTPETVVFGSMPWHDLSEREIPLQQETLRFPACVVSTAEGKTSQGYESWRNVAQGLFSQLPQAQWQLAGQKPAASVSVSASGIDSFRAVVLDMGETVVGPACVKVADGKAGTVLDLFFHEALGQTGTPVMPEPQKLHSKISMANRLLLTDGATEYDFFNLIGFRYVTLVLHECTENTEIAFQVRDTGYPLNSVGSFECSDEELCDIWKICRRTQQVCCLDSYVDTPWREQAQWWGDARIQFWNTMALTCDYRLLVRGIRSIAAQKVPNGLTYGHAPTKAHSCILPDFSLVWIMTIYDHYYQTGDLSLFEEQLLRIREVFKYFADEAPRQNDLLAHDKRYWLFLDWSTLKKDGAPTLYNMWYLLTLRTLKLLFRLTHRNEDAKWIAALESRQRKAIETHLFDEKTCLFRDGINEDGTPSDIHSVHSQVFAVMLNLKPEYHSNFFSKRLLPFLRGEKLPVPAPSTYWTSYLLTLARENGYASEALQFIRRMWSPMIPYSTCPEVFEPLLGKHSLSHAWSAHPLFHLQQILGGVTQSSVGWKTVVFDPYFAEEVDETSTVVPTPFGVIESSWKREKDSIKVKLALPKGIVAEIRLEGRHGFATGQVEYLIEK